MIPVYAGFDLAQAFADTSRNGFSLACTEFFANVNCEITIRRLSGARPRMICFLAIDEEIADIELDVEC